MKATTILASSQVADGTPLVLEEHDGEHYLEIDGAQLMSTRASASEQEMADLTCRELPPKAKDCNRGRQGARVL